jgi:hypothetical protein
MATCSISCLTTTAGVPLAATRSTSSSSSALTATDSAVNIRNASQLVHGKGKRSGQTASPTSICAATNLPTASDPVVATNNMSLLVHNTRKHVVPVEVVRRSDRPQKIQQRFEDGFDSAVPLQATLRIHEVSTKLAIIRSLVYNVEANRPLQEVVCPSRS